MFPFTKPISVAKYIAIIVSRFTPRENYSNLNNMLTNCNKVYFTPFFFHPKIRIFSFIKHRHFSWWVHKIKFFCLLIRLRCNILFLFNRNFFAFSCKKYTKRVICNVGNDWKRAKLGKWIYSTAFLDMRKYARADECKIDV